MINDNPELFQYYYHGDHLGSTSVITNLDGEVVQHVEYVPFGEVFIEERNNKWNTPFLFNAKELDEETGLYYYGARYYDPRVSVWLSTDPLQEKYPNVSTYAYCVNNPVNAIDPDGRSTWVMNNSDGTYRVIGGNLNDKDLNIYIYSMQDGNLVRGKSIGLTSSITSFYDSDRNDGKGAWATGSIINPKDNSGRDFLKNNIIGADPEVGYYMNNAKTNQRYDFKATNGTNQPIYGEKDYYRGMPLGKNSNGDIVYTSARDIGNIAAGYVAGVHGVSWNMTRKEFDKLQSTQDNRPSVEGISTQNAQRFGWNMGHEKAVSGLIPRLWRARTTIWDYLKK